MLTIAEVGCNHMGDMDIAREMIVVAASFCKVDVVKFQKRTNRELLSEEEYGSPHPNPRHSYGDTYGAHRDYLELDLEQHRQLKECCEHNGVTYSTSVWDLTAAKQITSLAPDLIKIPSACNTDEELLSWLCAHFMGEIHIALGMTRRSEEQQIVKVLREHGRTRDVVLYACTSGYPVPFKDVCLEEIKRLKDIYGDEMKGIGFSGHHLGIAVDIAALAFGAEYFERHFTLDRTAKGTDHSASLEMDGLRRLVRDLGNVGQALGAKPEEVLPIELPQRQKLKRGVGHIE